MSSKTSPCSTSTSVELCFTPQELVGLDDQVRSVKCALRDVMRGQAAPGVCISGLSGAGKSTLVRQSLSSPENNSMGGSPQYSFVEGRFDEVCSHRPYSAIVAALSQLCEHLEMSDIDRLKKRLQDDDLATLAIFLPTLKLKLESNETRQHEKSYNSVWGEKRLQETIKGLLKTATETLPLVLFLDDIQWADDESLQLIEAVMLESGIPNFLCVVAYRTDEALHTILSSIDTNKRLVKVLVKNLGIPSLNVYLSNILQRNPEVTDALSRVVHRKTHGNVYFTIQFLKRLQQEPTMLTYSVLSNRWEWDLEKIASETSLADNVADMVADRIQRLPDKTQLALQIASCFGHRFDSNVLGTLVDHWYQNPKVTENWSMSTGMKGSVNMSAILESACRDELLDQIQVQNTELHVYKFSHSRVQEASYNAIGGDDDCAMYHLKVGRLLWRVYNTHKEQEWMLLVAVDQLNRSMSLLDGEEEEVALAMLNIEASSKVCSTCAFAAAAKYARTALQLLGKEKWKRYYDTTLTATKISCEMEYCSGNFEQVECMVSEVQANARTMEDRFDVLLTEVNSLASQSYYPAAIVKGRTALSDLDKSFALPAKPSIRHIVLGFSKVKRLIIDLSDDDILRYKGCFNSKVEKALLMTSTLIRHAFFAQNRRMFAAGSLQLMQLSLFHGRTKYLSFAMSAYSVIMLKTGDVERGRRYGLLSLKLLSLNKTKDLDAEIHMLHHAFCHHLYAPFQQSLDPLLQSYRLGMSVSNVEGAHFSLVMYAVCYILSGLPLASLSKDIEAFVEDVSSYNMYTPLTVICIHRQFALNLMDSSAKKPNTKIAGEAMSIVEEKLGVNYASKVPKLATPILFNEMILAYLFGERKQAVATAKEREVLSCHDYPISIALAYPFYRSLIWIDEIRHGKIQYWLYLRRELKIMRLWVKQGFVNCHHMLQIMEAEVASLKTRRFDKSAIRKLYETAINVASRSGFNHNAALACELYGAHLRRNGEVEESNAQLSKSVRKYKEWDAHAKVAQIKRRYKDFEPISSGYSEHFTVKNLSGRERHAEVHQETKTTDWMLKSSKNGSVLEPDVDLSTSRRTSILAVVPKSTASLGTSYSLGLSDSRSSVPGFYGSNSTI